VLANLLYKLAQLYASQGKDDKRAVQCLVRVLQLEPERKEALELATDVYAREKNWLGALGALQQLATLETDLGKRVGLLHRAAQVQEDGFKDARHALTLYRAALELNPTYLPAVEALARFHDRQSDTQSLRVLIDTTARRLRAGLSGGPRDAGAFHALFRIFALRRAPDRMAMTAGVLEWMGSIEAEERASLERLKLREQYPGAALADPALDDYLFDSRVPAGVRNVLRLVEEPLGKSMRADVKALGLQRSDRLPKSGHAVRDIGNRIAADLGLRDFDLYVSPHLKKSVVLELTDPPSMCIGGALELDLRFLFARFFKMAQLRLSVALRLEPGALAALVAGVVRQFVPDFQPAGVDSALIAAESVRLTKVLPKKMIAELHPFALECASPTFDLLGIAAGLNAAADRAGLLACGTARPGLAMLERMGADGAARALALFAVGDELPELRRIVGTSIG
jgi:tetratricopeptide (TPR) repeat protein